jgi:hypothetical protein
LSVAIYVSCAKPRLAPLACGEAEPRGGDTYKDESGASSSCNIALLQSSTTTTTTHTLSLPRPSRRHDRSTRFRPRTHPRPAHQGQDDPRPRCVAQLARRPLPRAEPGLVILGLRNETKAKEVASTLSPIPTRTFPVDFASFANVRTAAQQVLAMDDQIDVLVNNIGTMASPYYKTEDGFESQLQLNHLSFFLFTNLIMDKLIASKTRIVNITSEGYSLGGIRYHDWNFHVSTAAVSTSTHGRLRL